MAKPSIDHIDPVVGLVRRAARTLARHVNVRAAGRQLRQIVDDVAPPEQAEDDRRAGLARVVAPSPGPACLARLGAAGVLMVTAAAVFVGLLDAGLDAVHPTAPYAVPTDAATPETPAIRPSCEEPASGCPQRGDAVEGRWSR